MDEHIKSQLLESADVKRKLAESFSQIIGDIAGTMAKAIKGGAKIMFCGNGGSAADSQHLAAELVVRLSGKTDRQALPGLALTTDSSILTAAGNDYGFDHLFSRQVKALGSPGDILVAISTSGNSANVIKAVEAARAKKIGTVGFCGGDGGKLAGIVDKAILVPSADVQRIQEAHITIGHILIGLAEREVAGYD